MIKFHWLEVGQPLQDTCTYSQYFIYRLYRYNKTEWREGFNSQHSVPLQQPLIILLPTLCRNLREEHFRNFNFRITNQRPAGLFFFSFWCVFQQHQLKSQSHTAPLCLQNWHEVLQSELGCWFWSKAKRCSLFPAAGCSLLTGADTSSGQWKKKMWLEDTQGADLSSKKVLFLQSHFTLWDNKHLQGEKGA